MMRTAVRPSGSSNTAIGRIMRIGLVVAPTLLLGACAQMGGLDVAATGNEPPATVATSPTAELEKATAFWGRKASENPRDSEAVLNYARNLKALGRKQDAIAALQGSYLYNANNLPYLSEYGRLALDLGQVSTATRLLERADDPSKPDWRVISARGTAYARQERFKEAIPFFQRALELSPKQPSVLSNLAMAHAMDGEPAKAETLLREADALGANDPRVRQNLALVLGLQGKTEEARRYGGDDAAAEPAPATSVASTAVAATPLQPAAPAKTADKAPEGADADAIIKAAIAADAAREKAASTPISTSATTRPKRAKRAAASSDLRLSSR